MKIKQTQDKSQILFITGVCLIVISVLLWLSLLIIPFLPISVLRKGSLAAAVLIAGEVAFWLGAILTGKKLSSIIKAYFKKLKNQ